MRTEQRTLVYVDQHTTSSYGKSTPSFVYLRSRWATIWTSSENDPLNRCICSLKFTPSSIMISSIRRPSVSVSHRCSIVMCLRRHCHCKLNFLGDCNLWQLRRELRKSPQPQIRSRTFLNPLPKICNPPAILRQYRGAMTFPLLH